MPGPSGSGNASHLMNAASSVSLDLEKMAQDGGAKLINFLLSAAVSSTVSAKEKIPEVVKLSVKTLSRYYFIFACFAYNSA